MPSPSPNTAYNNIVYASKIITICIHMALLLFFVPFGLIRHIHAEDILPADFTLESYSIEADCITSYVLIRWSNSAEPNVTGFKVHVRSIDIDSGVTENRWINPIAVGAKGEGKEYTIIDSALKPNTYHTFRVYGFEKNNLLSKAKQIMLDDDYTLYCIRLPLTID